MPAFSAKQGPGPTGNENPGDGYPPRLCLGPELTTSCHPVALPCNHSVPLGLA